jgi:hypothetical protein
MFRALAGSRRTVAMPDAPALARHPLGAKSRFLAFLQECDISGELVSESNQNIGPARSGIDIDERGRIA